MRRRRDKEGEREEAAERASRAGEEGREKAVRKKQWFTGNSGGLANEINLLSGLHF